MVQGFHAMKIYSLTQQSLSKEIYTPEGSYMFPHRGYISYTLLTQVI